MITKQNLYKTLNREEKGWFNEILLGFGYKVEPCLEMVLPIHEFGARKSHDGFQPLTSKGKYLRKKQQKV